MKKTILLVLLSAGTLCAQTPAKQADAPQTTSGNSTLEYTTTGEIIRNARQGLLTPGTLYYAPAKTKEGEPKLEPVIGEDAGYKFIEIQGSGDGNNLQITKTMLTRCSKIPDNAPKTITVSFAVRLNKEALTGWEVMPKGKKNRKGKEEEPWNAKLLFGTTDRLGAPTIVEIPANKGWINKSIKLDIPEGAKFLYLELYAMKGEKLAFANWTIN